MTLSDVCAAMVREGVRDRTAATSKHDLVRVQDAISISNGGSGLLFWRDCERAEH